MGLRYYRCERAVKWKATTKIRQARYPAGIKYYEITKNGNGIVVESNVVIIFGECEEYYSYSQKAAV